MSRDSAKQASLMALAALHVLPWLLLAGSSDHLETTLQLSLKLGRRTPGTFRHLLHDRMKHIVGRLL
jgi:hypothetical protein